MKKSNEYVNVYVYYPNINLDGKPNGAPDGTPVILSGQSLPMVQNGNMNSNPNMNGNPNGNPQTAQAIAVVPRTIQGRSAAEQKEPKKQPLPRLLTVLFFLLFTAGLFVPYYYSLSGGLVQGSLLSDNKTIYDLLLPQIQSGLSLTTILQNVFPWSFAFLSVFWLVLSIINTRAKSPLTWLMIGCFVSLHGLVSYINLSSVQLQPLNIPGFDLIAVGLVLSAIIFVLVLLHKSVNQFAKGKNFLPASVISLMLSVAALAIIVLSPDLNPMGAAKAVLAAVQELAGMTTTAAAHDVMQYTFFATVFLLYLNVFVEFIRIVGDAKTGAITLFRYVVMSVVACIFAFLCYYQGGMDLVLPVSVAVFLLIALIVNFTACFPKKEKAKATKSGARNKK